MIIGINRYQRIDNSGLVRRKFYLMHDVDGHSIDLDHRNTIFGIRCFVDSPRFGLGSLIQLYLGLFWTPYADWIYTVISLSGVLLMCWLVLGRPPQR